MTFRAGDCFAKSMALADPPPPPASPDTEPVRSARLEQLERAAARAAVRRQVEERSFIGLVLGSMGEGYKGSEVAERRCQGGFVGVGDSYSVFGINASMRISLSFGLLKMRCISLE